VADGDPGLGRKTGDALRGFLDRAHAVVHVIDLAFALQLSAHRLGYELVVVGRDVGLDRLALLGRCLDHAHVADPAHRHVQRARDRRCRQRQDVELRAQLLEPLLLHHSEAVLFVDDQQAEPLEPDVALQQPVRADDDVDVP